MAAELKTGPTASELATSNSNLMSQLAAGGGGGGGGGGASSGEQQKNIVQFLIDTGPEGALNSFLKFFKANASNPENAAPNKAVEMTGLPDANIRGTNGFDSSQGNWIYRALKMVFSDRSITDQAVGVGGGEAVHSNQAATAIEPPHVPDFAALVGQAGSMGNFPTGEAMRGESVTPIGPNMGGANYIG